MVLRLVQAQMEDDWHNMVVRSCGAFWRLSRYPRFVHTTLRIAFTFSKFVIVEHSLNLSLPKLPGPYSYHQQDLPEDCQLPASDHLVRAISSHDLDASLHLLHAFHDVFSVRSIRV